MGSPENDGNEGRNSDTRDVEDWEVWPYPPLRERDERCPTDMPNGAYPKTANGR